MLTTVFALCSNYPKRKLYFRMEQPATHVEAAADGTEVPDEEEDPVVAEVGH